MRRREVIAALGAAAISTPFAGRAEPTGGLRRIGALVSVAETDLEAPRRIKMFMTGLQEEGWREANVLVEWRWLASGPDWPGAVADELVAMRPEVLVVSSTALTGEILQRTTTIPVVFALVADPVASGFVESLARPGGNTTGFLNFEASLASKWVQLLKEVAPDLTHVAMIFNPHAAALSGAYFYPPFEAAAVSLGIRPSRAPVNSPEEIDAAAAGVAAEQGGGLVVAPDFSPRSIAG
jgi:putative tryptophan/tyrosine transport system substrate-binding protein